jgi:uncharacterized protein (TIRG00374 family)
MSSVHFFRNNWKLLVNIITFVALAVLVYAIRDDLMDTFQNFSRVNLYVLCLVIPLEAVGYHAQAKMYEAMFVTLGRKLRYKDLLRAAIELNFVNHVFPSGGVTGISYFGIRMKALGARGAQATLVQTMKLVLGFLSFEILLLFGMFLLAANGKASNLTIFIGTMLAAGLLGGTALFAYIIGSKSRINRFFTWLTRFINRVIQVVRPGHPETINIENARGAFDEFHESYALLRTKRTDLKSPFWWALVYNVTEVLVVYVVFIAFGEWVNLGAVILAYAIANFAGLVSVMPGGVGIYEALMISVLATAGVSPALTLPVVVMYRVVSTALQIPPGYYLYSKALRGSTTGTPQAGVA